ncbi:MAG: nuclease [Desulfobacteraceae bacterium]|nr:MAG: nuclease [Desulfobacteraceae bacterium]
MVKKRLLFIVFFAFIILITTFAHADISGKVVGVADGDTITVLENQTQYKIRIFGVDCPEKSQDFGTQAKQFTSDLVFGKTVQVIPEEADRYGRTVGTVMVDGKCLNEEIVKAGFAWVYHQYCKKPICDQWNRYEEAAKNAKIGLWSHPNPTPPWEFRHGAKASSKTENISTTTNAAIAYHGNVKSMIFHAPGCKAFNCKNCTVVFHSRAEAIGTGYKPCGMCKP